MACYCGVMYNSILYYKPEVKEAERCWYEKEPWERAIEKGLFLF